MLFVAGEDRDYELSWFSKTAHMLETVNATFEPFKMIYKSVSIFGTHPTGGQTLENDRMKWRVSFTSMPSSCQHGLIMTKGFGCVLCNNGAAWGENDRPE